MHDEAKSQNPTPAEPHGTSVELLARYQGGDDDAAEAIFQRYMERLTRLARSRLSPRLASRTDPEDVVLSAWRSFFIAARAGKFSLGRSGDLWRLLASITMHKIYRQARRHTAEMRSVTSEQSLEQINPALDRAPTPEEAIALADELAAVMKRLDACGRRVLELRLQGENLAAIAADTGRSERTIRRLLAQIREMLLTQLGAEADE